MKTKKLIAAAAVAGLSLMGLAAPAFAETSTAEIDTTKEADSKIVLTKYEGPSTTGTAGDGTAANPARKKLGNVKFEVRKLAYTPTGGTLRAVDLTKTEDWTAIKDLDCSDGIPDTFSADATYGTKEYTTGQNTGTVDIPVGDFSVYYITETAYQDAVDAADGATAVKVVTPVEDFCVTVPFPKASATAGNEWLYTVNVEPKNTSSADTKTAGEITAAQSQEDATLEWDISLTVPPLQAGKTVYTKFGMVDDLPDSLVFVEIKDVKHEGTDLAATNYTVTGSTTEAGAVVKFDVAEGYMASLTAGDQVTLTVVTKLAEGYTGATAVSNDFYPKNDNYDPYGDGTNPGTPTEGEDAAFGGFQLTKKSNDTKAELSGAEFKIVDPGATATDCTGVTAESEAVLTAAQDSGLISDANGKVAVDKLLVAKGKTIAADASKVYCLVETKAPAGYALNETPMALTIKANQVSTGYTMGEFLNTRVNKDDIPSLPLTGAQGRVLLIIAGLAVLGLAAGFGLRTARKNH